jgi:transcriptional regulator with XRE-family HTH domain
MIPHEDFENRLREYRVDEGLSLKSLSKACGVNPSTIQSLELGYTSPLDRWGQVRGAAFRLLEYYRAEFEDTFPREVCRLADKLAYGEVGLLFCQMPGAVMAEYPPGFEPFECRHDFQTIAEELLSNKVLSERAMDILTSRAMGWTIPELAEKHSLSRARITQIFERSLSRIRIHYGIRGYCDVWRT